jgi:hypothetical protein
VHEHCSRTREGPSAQGVGPERGLRGPFGAILAPTQLP